MQEFYYKYLPETDSFGLDGYAGDESEVVIPATQAKKTVTMVFESVFKGHTEITSVKFPDAVSFIGGFLFDGCTNLRRIELPKELEHIWQYAFVRCGVEEIILPENVKFIPPYAFKNCKNLRRIVCNDSLGEICAHAFEGCDQLKEIVYGSNTKIPKEFY
ncbi:MAG: leucine-rich repeat domain-containing protein [Bacteroidales bacterium]|nr:leucine-rich repeat domain-containing protein [Bacteroidales bacterium]